MSKLTSHDTPNPLTDNVPIILCFVEYYLPGYCSGGPVRSIVNFVDHLGDEFDIHIVTRDRDALDSEPYPNVQIDAWNKVGKAQVFYASNKTINIHGIANLISVTHHDVLYLNSFFALVLPPYLCLPVLLVGHLRHRVLLLRVASAL